MGTQCRHSGTQDRKVNTTDILDTVNTAGTLDMHSEHSIHMQ